MRAIKSILITATVLCLVGCSKSSQNNNNSPYMDIVGVVGDLKYWGLESKTATAWPLRGTLSID